MKKVPVFPNLMAEIARNNLQISEIANGCGFELRGFYRKLVGDQKLSMEEANLIKEKFFNELKTDYLFSANKSI